MVGASFLPCTLIRVLPPSIVINAQRKKKESCLQSQVTLLFSYHATNVLNERVVSHVGFVCLSYNLDRNIHLAICQTTLSDILLISVIYLEDSIELLS